MLFGVVVVVQQASPHPGRRTDRAARFRRHRKLAADQQATILAVTHDEKIYDRLDSIYKLRDGLLVETEEHLMA